MYAYTLHAPTLQDAFATGLLPARPQQDTAQKVANVISNEHIQVFGRTIAGQLVKTLKSRPEAFTRLELANQTGLSKSTIANHIEELVKRGLVYRQDVIADGRPVYLYSLPNAHPLGIWRTRCFTWRLCPSCGAKRRLVHLPSGDWLHWCEEHHSEVLSKEIVG